MVSCRDLKVRFGNGADTFFTGIDDFISLICREAIVTVKFRAR